MANILVIDDEPGLRALLIDVLESLGHTVVEAANGVAGVNAFVAGQFDVVITDIIMPDQEGIETIQKIRKLRPEQKIIAMSGGGRTKTTEFLVVAKEHGAERVLKKPFTTSALREAVQACLVPVSKSQ